MNAQPQPLTKTDLKALKSASRVMFNRVYDEATNTYTGAVIPVLDADAPANTSGFDQYRPIPCWHQLRDYGSLWTTPVDPNTGVSGWYTLYNPTYVDTWLAILGLLAEGDELIVIWTIDNNNQLLRDAGLHQDELDLSIYRKGVRKWTLHIAHAVSNDDAFRMARRFELPARWRTQVAPAEPVEFALAPCPEGSQA